MGTVDLNKFIELVRQPGRPNKCFYHFTDTRNLTSIKTHGLLSMRQMRLQGIDPVTGGNQHSLDADRLNGMDDYVHLCFWRQHPMEFLAKKDGRVKDTAFLSINVDVILLPGVLITDQVSNKSGVRGVAAADKLGELDLKAIYTKTDWKSKEVQARLLATRKYEVLVPAKVPLNKVIAWS